MQQNHGGRRESTGREKTWLDKGKCSIVPSVAVATRGILTCGQSAPGGLPETNLSLIREGHSTVEAVLASKHPMSVEDLRGYGQLPFKREESLRMLTSIFLACQPTPLATFPLASDNLRSSSLQG